MQINSFQPLEQYQRKTFRIKDVVVEEFIDLIPYEKALEAMRFLINNKHTSHTFLPSQEAIWLMQHPSVYTAGLSSKIEDFPLSSHKIPVIKTCRGGQLTYHGPGQCILYPLLNLKKHLLDIRGFVSLLEQIVIDSLSHLGVTSHRIKGHPGVYVVDKKIASLGLRIRKGFSYHGLSVNVHMDLKPFEEIVPCGMPTMKMTQVSDWASISFKDFQQLLLDNFLHRLLQNG